MTDRTALDTPPAPPASSRRGALLGAMFLMATSAEIPPPILTSRPSSAFSPSAVPAMLPMLKTSPPNTSRAARP